MYYSVKAVRFGIKVITYKVCMHISNQSIHPRMDQLYRLFLLRFHGLFEIYFKVVRKLE